MTFRRTLASAAKALLALSQYRNIRKVDVPILEGRMLEGRCAFVVGGTSGIGRAIAQCFLAHGAQVVIASRRQEALASVSSELKCGAVQLDMRAVSVFASAIECAERDFCGGQPFDIFVISSGVHGDRPFGYVDEETWDTVMDTNLKGPYFFCQTAGEYMKKRGVEGNILLIGSASALKPGWTPYEVSKNGLAAVVRGAADSLISDGIIVNCLAPGPVVTPMMKGLSAEGNIHNRKNPSGRFALPEEIASLAVLLVSSNGRLIVGSSLYATGGSGTISFE